MNQSIGLPFQANRFRGRRARIFLSLFLVFSSWGVFICKAQTPSDTIRIRLGDYNNDTLWFGISKGRRVEPLRMVLRGPDMIFRIPVDPRWPEGLYGLDMRRSPQARPEYASFWLRDGQRSFTIRTATGTFHADAEVEGSAENAAYCYYLGQYEKLARQMASASDQWHLLPDEASFAALRGAEDKMERFQKGFIQRHAGTTTARMVAQTRFQNPPPEITDPTARLAWLRVHFFENMDLASPELMRQPLWIDRLDYYLMMLPYPDGQTLRDMTDSLLGQLERINPEFLAFYVPYLIAMTEGLSRKGMDELYVHLVMNYALSERVSAIPEDRKEFLRLNAEHKERLFVGRKAPNLSLRDLEGTTKSLYDLTGKWTLLVFWLPDCQVCARDLPRIKDLWQRHRNNGLQVVAVCGRSGTGDNECMSKAVDLELPEEWHILHDPERQSRFQSLYNVRSYPQLYLLDGQRNIMYKQGGSAPPATLEKVLFKAMAG
jgi:peroxiredoxin